MHPDCQEAASEVLGKDLSDKDAQALENLISKHRRLLAQRNPMYASLSRNEQMRMAGENAAREMIESAVKKRQRIERDILAIDRKDTQYGQLVGDSDKPTAGVNAIKAMLVSPMRDDGSGTRIESTAAAFDATKERYLAHWVHHFDNAVKGWFGLIHDAGHVRDFVKELHGEDSGNALAKTAAAKWKEISEEAVNAWNAVGGHVRFLRNYAIPTSHDGGAIAQAGADSWIAKTMPLLKRSMYMNEDGTRMNDGRVHSILQQAFDSIVTGGRTDPSITQEHGASVLADRHAQHRQLFFKDSDAWLKYHQEFGKKSVPDILAGYLEKFARDTSVVDAWGPNAEQNFHMLNDRALSDGLRNATEGGAKDREKVIEQHIENKRLFEMLSGQDQAVNPRIQQIGQATRNLLSAAMLGKTRITAIGDQPYVLATLLGNKASYAEYQIVQSMLSLDRGLRQRVSSDFGVGISSAHAATMRWASEMQNAGWTSRVSNTELKMTGALRAWDIKEQGIATTLAAQLTRILDAKTNFSDLNVDDHGFLARKGITESTWKVWQLAEREDYGMKSKSISPQTIMEIPDEKLASLGDPATLRRDAARQLGGHLLQEARNGAQQLSTSERLMMTKWLAKPGTLAGEAARTMLLFKSFDYGAMVKHWSRFADTTDPKAKAAYGGAVVLYGTLISGVAAQLWNLAQGKNPENMASPKFWFNALLRSGALGLFGSYLNETKYDGPLESAVGTLLGPLYGEAKDVGKALTGPNKGAKLIKLAINNTPLLNVYYARAALNHFLGHTAQDIVSPGYLDRVNSRAQQDSDQPYWWGLDRHPTADSFTQGLPDRLPDLTTAWNPQRGREEIEQDRNSLERLRDKLPTIN